MTRLTDLGEFAVIDRFAGSAGGPSVIVGIGDDAAVLESPGGCMLLTTDMLVEGRHFLASRIEPHALGYKALAVNVSDIAAMGGAPGYALVSLALPDSVDVEFIDGLREGFQQAAEQYGVTLAGGDTVGSTVIVVNVALTGSIPHGGRWVARAGARAGDLVCVTNSLGRSDGGLRLLLAGDHTGLGADGAALLHAHAYPQARVAEGQAASSLVSAMIDVSDGLLADLGHICTASGVGAEIDADAVPVASELAAVAAALGFNPLESALGGGEDYELLMTVAPESFGELETNIRAAGSDLAIVGRIVEGSEVSVPGVAVAHLGWDHFHADA